MTIASGMTLALSDEDLVASARDGDPRAFEELYERYRPKIRTFALRLTRDPHRADDITQEVFISALRRLRESTRPIAFRPWIYEIARNACIDEYRRSSRTREVPIERDGVDRSLAALATSPPPHVAVESKQQLDHLRGAFRGLSERHHRIIVLRELEGLSYSQIGDQLGMSKMVVESTLFRARRRLSEEYEDLASGRRCEHVRSVLQSACGQPVRRMGLRERRALTRHLEHCGSCRREAAAVGLDSHLCSPKATAPAAALIPIPFMLRFLRRIGGSAGAAARTVHHAVLPAASWNGAVETVASAASDGRIAATAATVLAAAVGGGILTGAQHSRPAVPPRMAQTVITRHAGGAGAGRAGHLGSGVRIGALAARSNGDSTSVRGSVAGRSAGMPGSGATGGSVRRAGAGSVGGGTTGASPPNLSSSSTAAGGSSGTTGGSLGGVSSGSGVKSGSGVNGGTVSPPPAPQSGLPSSSGVESTVGATQAGLDAASSPQPPTLTGSGGSGAPSALPSLKLPG